MILKKLLEARRLEESKVVGRLGEEVQNIQMIDSGQILVETMLTPIKEMTEA